MGRLRGGLLGLGLEPGDRVGIVAANNWYFVVSYLAVLGAGGVAVPINPMSPVPEVERELAAIGARDRDRRADGAGHGRPGSTARPSPPSRRS